MPIPQPPPGIPRRRAPGTGRPAGAQGTAGRASCPRRDLDRAPALAGEGADRLSEAQREVLAAWRAERAQAARRRAP